MKNSKYMLTLTTLSVPFLLSLSIVTATSAHAASQRMVINYKGTGTAIPKVVPDTLSVGSNANGLLDANCFEADIFDLQSGELLGTAEDCLSEIAAGPDTDSGSGVQLVGTTVFNLEGGRLVVQGLTSVQAVNWPTENSDVVFTHITGANSPNDAALRGEGEFTSTGAYANASARVRLSGQVDLSQLSSGQITFDCIFVVDVDMAGLTGLTGERYDATQGEVFWERNPAFSEYEIFRDGELIANNEGTSFYDPTLESGVSYRYNVEAVTEDGRVSIGSITIPSTNGAGVN